MDLSSSEFVVASVVHDISRSAPNHRQLPLKRSTMGSRISRNIKCKHCDNMYGMNKTLAAHMKKAHQKEFLLGKKGTKIICSENGCGTSVPKSASAVREHLVKSHGYDITTKEKLFKSERDFRDWKEHFERKTFSYFVSSGKSVVDGDTVCYYYCNRSGWRQSKAKVRKMRASCKSGIVCTAFMKTRVLKDTGRLVVSYCPFHYRHERNLRFSRLPKELKIEISGKLSNNMTISEILRENEIDAEIGSRASLLNRHDVENVAHSFGLTTALQKKDDSVTELATKNNLVADATEQDGPDTSELNFLLDNIKCQAITLGKNSCSSERLKQCLRMLKNVSEFLQFGSNATETRPDDPENKKSYIRQRPFRYSNTKTDGFTNSKENNDIECQRKEVASGDHNYCDEPRLDPCPVKTMQPFQRAQTIANPAVVLTNQIQVPAAQLIFVSLPVQRSPKTERIEGSSLVTTNPLLQYPKRSAQFQAQRLNTIQKSMQLKVPISRNPNNYSSSNNPPVTVAVPSHSRSTITACRKIYSMTRPLKKILPLDYAS